MTNSTSQTGLGNKGNSWTLPNYISVFIGYSGKGTDCVRSVYAVRNGSEWREQRYYAGGSFASSSKAECQLAFAEASSHPEVKELAFQLSAAMALFGFDRESFDKAFAVELPKMEALLTLPIP